MRMLVIIGVLCGAVAGACSTGDKNDSTNADVSLPCTNDATAEAVRAGDYSVFARHYSETPTRELFPDDELDCRIHRAMLKPSDLPGWSSSDSLGGGAGTSSEHFFFEVGLGGCDITPGSLLSGLINYFEREGSDTEILDESIFVFAPPEVEEAFQAIEECLVPSLAARDGSSYRAEALDIDHDADEAVAFREFSGTGDDEVVADQIYLRYSNVIIRVRYASTGRLDVSQTQTFVRLAESTLMPNLAALDPDRNR